AAAPQTAQRNINLRVLRPLLIPLPPIRLQDRFAEIVARAAGLSTKHRAGAAGAAVLSEALAARAFGGV
ncbi:MAG: restriction endonuclease subunit S, partial [Gemmatimonadales bacterium]